jgi:hypothetical protein
MSKIKNGGLAFINAFNATEAYKSLRIITDACKSVSPLADLKLLAKTLYKNEVVASLLYNAFQDCDPSLTDFEKCLFDTLNDERTPAEIDADNEDYDLDA